MFSRLEETQRRRGNNWQCAFLFPILKVLSEMSTKAEQCKYDPVYFTSLMVSWNCVFYFIDINEEIEPGSCPWWWKHDCQGRLQHVVSLQRIARGLVWREARCYTGREYLIGTKCKRPPFSMFCSDGRIEKEQCEMLCVLVSRSTWHIIHLKIWWHSIDQ